MKSMNTLETIKNKQIEQE